MSSGTALDRTGAMSDARRGGNAMPSLSGFGCLVAIPREKITDKITRRVLAGMMVWWMGAGTHIGAYSHGIPISSHRSARIF
jgi:hypothetical protein